MRMNQRCGRLPVTVVLASTVLTASLGWADGGPDVTPGRAVVVRSGYTSVQVNVDASGANIPGDAANGPSIAVDPTDPNKIVIGWRQFDTVASDFRQAGWAYSHDGGASWTSPGVVEPGVSRTYPVLRAGANGDIYYHSSGQSSEVPYPYSSSLFKSVDAGLTWTGPYDAFGGVSPWIAVDQTGEIGRDNVYCAWAEPSGGDRSVFTRSLDGGMTFGDPVDVSEFPRWGTSWVGPDGEYYVAGRARTDHGMLALARSSSVGEPSLAPAFDLVTEFDLGGSLVPMPHWTAHPPTAGPLGRAWVAADHTGDLATRHVYVLASVDPPGVDWLDVRFARSTDGGRTFGPSRRVNDDYGNTSAWQWFGTMSVAPNGRIDAIWGDTRNSDSAYFSELYYSYSTDSGINWSTNTPVSPVFDSTLGLAGAQRTIGEYFDMSSDNGGVDIAYAATFNGEQDIYYLRIGLRDCNGNGIPDADDIAAGTSEDCNGNEYPDECEPDCNGNGLTDPCEITGGVAQDCDGDALLDECERDFDHDGVIDDCDDDIDNDGVPDAIDLCEFTASGVAVRMDGSARADTNGNCHIDLVDYKRLRVCLTGGGPGVAADQAMCLAPFDTDNDSDVDLQDASTFLRQFNENAGG